MKVLPLIIILLYLSPFHAKADTGNRTLSGSVTDANGEALPGVNLIWLGTTTGTTTDLSGAFELKRTDRDQQLVVSCIGFTTDTLAIAPEQEFIDIILQEGMELQEVNVVARKITLQKLRNSVMNTDMISKDELFRAACCNLGESFVTNPSVDVNYSDAATGAKQIRLLGLSGTYVQLLTENIPNFRGASAAYGLGYVPGPWMQSIQVSKGTSSVKNGYEALTGQINIEFKKPQSPEADWVSANLFASTTSRYEANADASVKLSDKWSTMLLAHYENETKTHDANDDGFADIPQVKQYNLFNRWAYMGDNYIFQAGIKALDEKRTSGQVAHGGHTLSNPYLIHMNTDRYEAFVKQAYVFDKEHNTNLALITAATIHEMDASYGHKRYNVDQQNAYASLIFETDFTEQHTLSTGLSFNYDRYDQDYRLSNDAAEALTRQVDKEAVTGGYAQYTYKPTDKLTLMMGLRGDYSNVYGFFVTPNRDNFLLASSRTVRIADDLKQEEAWNYGASIATYIPIAGKTLNLNAEYYYTDFVHQVVVDMDSNPHEVAFTNLDGRSFSHVFQVEATYPFFEGFSLMAAWRMTKVKNEINGILYEKSLTGKYKGLITASYKTPLNKWQFDVTWQQNGGGRMPTPYQLADGALSWSERYGSFAQLSMQVTRNFRHWSVYVGGENLTNFKQENPIVGADNPWGDTFDATMVWGPMHGAKGYIGIRFNWPRNE